MNKMAYEYMTSRTLSELMGVSRRVVNKWCQQGKIKATRSPSGWRTWMIPMSIATKLIRAYTLIHETKQNLADSMGEELGKVV